MRTIDFVSQPCCVVKATITVYSVGLIVKVKYEQTIEINREVKSIIASSSCT